MTVLTAIVTTKPEVEIRALVDALSAVPGVLTVLVVEGDADHLVKPGGKKVIAYPGDPKP